MRKVSLLFLFIVLSLTIINYKPLIVKADKINNDYILISTDKIDLADGTYIIFTTYEAVNNTSTRSNVFTKKGQKVATNYNSDNELLWTYTLNATYKVTYGISTYYTSANYATDIKNSNWKFSDGDAYFSANTAYGVGVFKYKLLLITADTVDINLSLTCDVNGNLS